MAGTFWLRAAQVVVAWMFVVCAQAADGVTANAILVGESGVFSGPSAGPALEYRAGAQMCFDQVNAKGGVGGRQIKLISYDDQFNPKQGAENTRKLLEEDKVLAFFGYVGTGTVMASMAQITQHRVPVIGIVSGTEVVRDPKFNLLFHTRASYSDEIAKMLQLLTTTGVHQIGLVYEDDPFGKAGMASARVAFERSGVKPVIETSIDMSDLGKIDAATAKVAAQVAKVQPGAIVMITAGKPSSSFIRAYLNTGSTAQFFGISVTSATDLLKDLGADAHGIVIAQVAPPVNGSLPISKEFLALAGKSGNKAATYNGLEGYIAAKVFLEALRRAGKEPTREKLITAMESLKAEDFGGFVVDFSNGQRKGTRYVDLSMIGKGGYFLH